MDWISAPDNSRSRDCGLSGRVENRSRRIPFPGGAVNHRLAVRGKPRHANRAAAERQLVIERWLHRCLPMPYPGSGQRSRQLVPKALTAAMRQSLRRCPAKRCFSGRRLGLHRNHDSSHPGGVQVALQAFQVRAQFRRRLAPQFAVLLHRLVHHFFQLGVESRDSAASAGPACDSEWHRSRLRKSRPKTPLGRLPSRTAPRRRRTGRCARPRPRPEPAPATCTPPCPPSSPDWSGDAPSRSRLPPDPAPPVSPARNPAPSLARGWSRRCWPA